MQHAHTIIFPKWLITVNETNDILENHGLVIDCGKIIDICERAICLSRYTANNYYYLDEHALLPGFINCHTHGAMSLLRGFADDLQLMDWLENHIWPAEAACVNPEFVKAGVKLALAEMIRGGTTCFNDSYFYQVDAADVIFNAKMRACLGECIFNFSTPWSPSAEVAFRRTQALIEYCQHLPLITATIAPHSPYGTDYEIMQRVHMLSEKYTLPIHIHLHETQSEVENYQAKHQCSALEHYHQMGITGPNLMAVHMTAKTERDIEILRETGTQVIHCPESNMKLASGSCRVDHLLSQGINVALGTDGAASNNDLDMIGEMRTAALVGKMITQNPQSLPAETVLRMATINGAKALNLQEKVGSLEVGKCADMIAIDLARIETAPCFNPVSQIVYASCREQVTHSWVAGNLLMAERQLKTLDIPEIKASVVHWRERLLSHTQNLVKP